MDGAGFVERYAWFGAMRDMGHVNPVGIANFVYWYMLNI